MPGGIRRALETKIDPPEKWDDVSGQHTERNGQSTNWEEHTWVVSTSDGELFLLQKSAGHWGVNGHK